MQESRRIKFLDFVLEWITLVGNVTFSLISSVARVTNLE